MAMKLGIFAKTYKANNVASLFWKIKQHGIGYVHYNMVCSGLSELPLTVPDDKISAINQQAKEDGITLIGLSATFNMIHPDQSIREEGLKSLETLAKTARALGTNFLSICTGTRNPDNKWKWHPDNALPEAWHDLLITLERALLIADQYDVILGVEPEESNVIRNAGLARKLLDEMKSDRLKIIIDPANLFENADDTTYINQLMEEALELLHKDIAMAHAKDRSLDGAFRPAGRGDIDFDFFVNKLKEIGFEGPVVMHGLEENEVEKTVSYLRSLM